ncbi:hypothetical protein BU23DRAFT_631790 [Bimuria novae-zelandiae CBS 107.79]|uniref:Uncharacterized protein n=1 Tax=Bimuria novae-zelandiae CBS 107.79 TaxID=1447943 RepID=A0A6A5UHT5_9PLEO|nr:hypothetical protein BU23DRAFT_631790 [Bimuria novae-zelandiae CBS 107.79]
MPTGQPPRKPRVPLSRPSRRCIHLSYSLTIILLLLCSVIFLVRRSPPKDPHALPPSYSAANYTATEVSCAFPALGQYGATPQSTYFVLLVLTVLLRRQPWLAAGIAASALTSSSVAAVHLAILLISKAQNGDDLTCTYGTGREEDSVPLCLGVYDADNAQAGKVVGAGLLAALPMAMWSRTFRCTIKRLYHALNLSNTAESPEGLDYHAFILVEALSAHTAQLNEYTSNHNFPLLLPSSRAH